MKLEVLRISSQEDSTNGVLYKVNPDKSREFLAYTLEDEERDEKVMHETRIPSGTYRITLRTVGGLPLSMQKDSKIFTKVCYGFVTFLISSIYLFIAVTLTSILAVACWLARLRRAIKKQKTGL
jgi:hypothetical protein